MSKQPVFVTTAAKRESSYPWRKIWVYAPKGMTDDQKAKWNDSHYDVLNLSAHVDKKEEANSISMKLYNLGPNPDPKEERKIISELKSICKPPFEKMTSLQRWEDCAVQMPGDIGGTMKDTAKEIMTARASGLVLEAACGFNSYFGTHPSIKEVIAMDYSRAMLERYPYPKRKRILFDLEQIVGGKKMDFFKDGRFQTIGCSYMTNYLSNPVAIFKEFKRLLSPGGNILLLENTKAGYPDLRKRSFSPDECAGWLSEAGFSVSYDLLDMPKNRDSEVNEGLYYLVEGIKSKNKKENIKQLLAQ